MIFRHTRFHAAGLPIAASGTTSRSQPMKPVPIRKSSFPVRLTSPRSRDERAPDQDLPTPSFNLFLVFCNIAVPLVLETAPSKNQPPRHQTKKAQPRLMHWCFSHLTVEAANGRSLTGSIRLLFGDAGPTSRDDRRNLKAETGVHPGEEPSPLCDALTFPIWTASGASRRRSDMSKIYSGRRVLSTHRQSPGHSAHER